MSLKLQYPTCRQLLADGRYCPCPALHDRSFCRHHTDERQRQRNLAKARQLKEYLEPKRAAQLEATNSAAALLRPEEELNAAIFDSLAFPTLDTSAAICVAATNVSRLLGAGHLSPRAATVMAKLIRIAEINLRQGAPILRSGLPTPPVTAEQIQVQHDFNRASEANGVQHGFNRASDVTDPGGRAGLQASVSTSSKNGALAPASSVSSVVQVVSSDPVPVLPGNGKPETGNHFVPPFGDPALVPGFGDEEGFVLPEESNLKRHHEDAKAAYGADAANEDRAALGAMPSVIDDLDPKYAHLLPMERGRAAYRDLKKAIAAAKENLRPSSLVKEVSA